MGWSMMRRTLDDEPSLGIEDTQLVPTIRPIRDLLDLLCTSSDDCIPGSRKVR